MKLINEKQIREKVPVSRAQIHTWRKENGFPKPQMLAGTKVNLWHEEEVDNWIQANLAEAKYECKANKKEAA